MFETPLTQPETKLIKPDSPASAMEPKKEGAAENPCFRFHAYHLAEALKLKEIAPLFDLKPLFFTPTKLIYALSPDCYLLLYNFGSVVFFNVGEDLQKSTLERLGQGTLESDDFILEIQKRGKNTVSFDKIVVDKLNRDRIELMALILAQSTALGYFENKIENITAQLSTITNQLEKTGGTKLSQKEIHQFIGMAMALKQNLLNTLSLLEKPDETWESKTLDDLYTEATMMFEIKDRFRTIDYKIKTLQENLELLSGIVTNRAHILLEIGIVGLIVLEVLLILYELFFKLP